MLWYRPNGEVSMWLESRKWAEKKMSTAVDLWSFFSIHLRIFRRFSPQILRARAIQLPSDFSNEIPRYVCRGPAVIVALSANRLALLCVTFAKNDCSPQGGDPIRYLMGLIIPRQGPPSHNKKIDSSAPFQSFTSIHKRLCTIFRLFSVMYRGYSFIRRSVPLSVTQINPRRRTAKAAGLDP